MKHASLLFGVAVALWLGAAGRAAADVDFHVPFVHIGVGGGGVRVDAPFVRLCIPTGPRRVMPAPVVGEPRLVPEVVVPPGVTPPEVVLPDARRTPAVPPVLPRQAPTLSEFASSFDAKGGSYEAWVRHPATGEAVKVCFTLPGPPRRVVVHKQEIVFRYGIGHTVRLEFCNDGTVKVQQ